MNKIKWLLLFHENETLNHTYSHWKRMKITVNKIEVNTEFSFIFVIMKFISCESHSCYTYFKVCVIISWKQFIFEIESFGFWNKSTLMDWLGAMRIQITWLLWQNSFFVLFSLQLFYSFILSIWNFFFFFICNYILNVRHWIRI